MAEVVIRATRVVSTHRPSSTHPPSSSAHAPTHVISVSTHTPSSTSAPSSTPTPSSALIPLRASTSSTLTPSSNASDVEPDEIEPTSLRVSPPGPLSSVTSDSADNGLFTTGNSEFTADPQNAITPTLTKPPPNTNTPVTGSKPTNINTSILIGGCVGLVVLLSAVLVIWLHCVRRTHHKSRDQDVDTHTPRPFRDSRRRQRPTREKATTNHSRKAPIIPVDMPRSTVLSDDYSACAVVGESPNTLSVTIPLTVPCLVDSNLEDARIYIDKTLRLPDLLRDTARHEDSGIRFGSTVRTVGQPPEYSAL
ncbi:hypothetical protein NLI96_g70 [Meripilus lineatus]|uniref:Mid2 domain-containing protein n=1 Tax=Meripilus lineatus TaxID=2056292 RepID=A0AAD5VFI8_9APHY|nr:hypothetical protein NLI96_g70 [Physisporinus lineatus]